MSKSDGLNSLDLNDASMERVVKAPTTNRRRQNYINKQNHILTSALKVFSRYGYYGTTIEQIVQEADISKANLFYYFKSKEALYLKILENILTDWLAPIRGFDVDEDPYQALSNYIRLKLELSRDQPEASKLFCFEIMQGAPIFGDYLSGPLKSLIKEKTAVMNLWMEQGKLKPIEPEHLIFMIWSTTQHYADFQVQIQAITGKNLSDKRFFESTCREIQSMIFSGVMPEPRA
ncbi:MULTISPECIES: HTH-type transcriptional regulator RutR [unclassified Vibrio]|uniref:HTH-type transcriptional regulator RutR n=1 Tax=Vibrio sp. HB236076 TaxID=3232307 RepID=A0AB39HDW3_9VIBR|nr:HTH-type transcriptional regulator RutR [Vibrio sp. HB161653]MDP5252756.1 HTH-type transcriptional regulator RutR [Vibrio sp. HB161653]